MFRETRSPEILDQRSLRSKRFTVKKIRFSFCDDEFLSVSLRFCVTPTWNTIHTYTYLIQFIFLFDCISMLFSFDHLFILLLDRVIYFLWCVEKSIQRPLSNEDDEAMNK